MRWFRSNIRWIIPIVLVLVVLGVVIGSRLRPVSVVVSPSVRGKAMEAVYATGTVEAEERVNVKAKTSGSIAEILVKEGDAVKKGDLLARIDNPVVSFELKRGRADLSAASLQAGKNAPQIAALRGQAQAITAELDQARVEQSRLQQLVDQRAVAQAELDRANARVRQLEGSLAANEAQQRASRIDLDANAARQAAQVQSLASRVADTEVHSPLDGVILGKAIEVGEVVAVNQTLFKVGDIHSLILEVSVDEADVSRVHDGENGTAASIAAVTLYAFPKQILSGKVFDVFPDANRERKAFLVKVRLDAPPQGLRSGMSAEVNIITNEKEGTLLIPSQAEADNAVWVVEGGRARHKTVKVGIRDLLRAEIVEGLKEGEEVVVEGQDKLVEGKRVTTTVRPQDKLDPLPDQNQPVRSTL